MMKNGDDSKWPNVLYTCTVIIMINNISEFMLLLLFFPVFFPLFYNFSNRCDSPDGVSAAQYSSHRTHRMSSMVPHYNKKSFFAVHFGCISGVDTVSYYECVSQ